MKMQLLVATAIATWLVFGSSGELSAQQTPGIEVQVLQLAQDAGTGCGWCIPYLIRIAEDPDGFALSGLEPGEYATLRDEYRRTKQPKNTF